MLNEADSLALLAARGIPVVPHRLCRSRAEAIAAFEAIGGPVVVKGCSADIAHKSELGLVKLGVKTREEAGEVWAQMEGIIRKHGARFDGVIVAAMAGGRREIMIGAHRDPVFGPVVAVGDGGKYVEIFRDTALLLPPFSKDDAREALGKLRIAPLFAGVRGEPPMDVDALVRRRGQDRRIDARSRGQGDEPRPQSGTARQRRQGLRRGGCGGVSGVDSVAGG